jgi:hypothetical protein
MADGPSRGKGLGDTVFRAFSYPALGAVLVLAVSLRLGPVLESPETRRGGLGPYADPALYHGLALNLLEGRGFTSPNPQGQKASPVIFRAPAYPLFLAGAYAALGAGDATDRPGWIRAFTAVRVIQCLMDASLCLAVYLVLACAFPGRPWIGLLGALLQALNPYGAHWARTILTEPLSGFLLCWCAALLCAAQRKRWPILFITAGLLGGALVLARPEYLPWVPAAGALALMGKEKSIASRLSGPVLFVLCAALAVAPWTARNALVFKRFIPVASGSVGELLHRGTFEGSNPWKGWAWCPPSVLSGKAEEREMSGLYAAYIAAQLSGGEEVFAIDAAFTAKALKIIEARSLECAKAWITNIPRLWYQKYVRMYADPEPPGWPILWALALAAIGLAAGGIARPALLIALSAPLYLTCLYLPFHIESRYSTPALPLVAALAAAGAGQAIAVARWILKKAFPAGTERRRIVRRAAIAAASPRTKGDAP